MQVMIVYVLLVFVAETAAFGVGTVLDRMVPSISMILFMVLFFGILAVCWPIAVMVTEKWFMPKARPSNRTGRDPAANPAHPVEMCFKVRRSVTITIWCP